MSNARKYEKLGQEIARLIGPGPGEENVRHQRQALRAVVVSAARSPSKRRRYALLAALATVIAVGTFLLIRELSPGQVTFWIGTDTESGKEGEWLKAPANKPLPLRFDDGTNLEVSEGSSVRVLTARREKVEIELSLGTVKASINKRTTKSSWTVHAGSYSITALGTIFEVSWNPESSLLAVKVWEGNVILQGGDIQKQGIVVDENRQLDVREDGEWTIKKMQEARAERKTGTAIPADTMEVVEPLSPAIDKQPMKPRPAREPEQKEGKRTASLTAEPTATWQEYYDSRMYAQVLEEAEKQGLENLYESLDDKHLWQLANSARYVKRAKVAISALLALRRRFQDSSKAPVATFLLGRISSEISRDHREACNWFLLYLQEYPGGKLTEESLGRSIDSCKRAGMTSKSISAAKMYMKEYPNGSYANLATSVLSK